MRIHQSDIASVLAKFGDFPVYGVGSIVADQSGKVFHITALEGPWVYGASIEEEGLLFFRREVAPMLRRSGTPEDGIAFLERRHIEGLLVNPEAARETVLENVKARTII